MIERELIDAAIAESKRELPYSPEGEAYAIAHMVASSLSLEGIYSTAEEVLVAAAALPPESDG